MEGRPLFVDAHLLYPFSCPAACPTSVPFEVDQLDAPNISSAIAVDASLADQFQAGSLSAATSVRGRCRCMSTHINTPRPAYTDPPCPTPKYKR